MPFVARLKGPFETLATLALGVSDHLEWQVAAVMSFMGRLTGLFETLATFALGMSDHLKCQSHPEERLLGRVSKGPVGPGDNPC